MKTPIVLALALALLAGGAAAAAPSHHPVRHAAVHKAAHRAALRKASLRHRLEHRRVRRRVVLTRAVKARPGPAPARTVASSSDEKLGFYKADGKAGWGWHRRRSDAVVGFYKRPPLPETPHPGVYDDKSQGAVGVAMSIKLGH